MQECLDGKRIDPNPPSLEAIISSISLDINAIITSMISHKHYMLLIYCNYM